MCGSVTCFSFQPIIVAQPPTKDALLRDQLCVLQDLNNGRSSVHSVLDNPVT